MSTGAPARSGWLPSRRDLSDMKEYEITCTFLNGCAGAAYPQNSFDEAELSDPADYIRRRHSRDFDKFEKEIRPDGRIVYSWRGTVTYIYEFTEI